VWPLRSSRQRKSVVKKRKLGRQDSNLQLPD
jgi:hypothetical protein